MSKFLFAVETIRTSQGWFNAGDQMPFDDLPDEEIDKLLTDKQAGTCHFASPLAQAAHTARKTVNKAQAAIDLKNALLTLSDEAPEELDEGFVDPTPVGEFPTVETFVRAGYSAENYDEAKRQWTEARTAGTDPPKPSEPDEASGETTESKGETTT